MSRRTARRNSPAAIPTTSSITSAGPASARWPAIAARTAATSGRGEVNPRQLEQYIADGCFHVHHLPEHMRYFKHVNRDYIDWARRQGLAPDADAGDLPALQRADAEDAAGRARARRRRAARAASRRASRPTSIRCRSGIRRSRMRPPLRRTSRMHAITQRPMAMYHSLGLAECLAAADPRRQPALHEPRAGRAARHRGRRLGVDHQPHRPGEGAGEADGGRQRRHGVDLERHRQARRRLGPRSRRAGGRRAASCSTT